jgi:hypothetical protein
MPYLINFCIALAVLHAGFTLQDKQPQKSKCTAAPPEQILVTVAAQPESPLVFEDVKFLSCIGRHGAESYRLRNRGKKPIRKLTVAAWTSHATGNLWGWVGRTPEEFVMPEQLVPMDENGVEIIPLTNVLREKLKLSGSMKGVVILMVVEVEYADGTKFSDKAASKALEDYFDKISPNDP